jgi:hypothetical protein
MALRIVYGALREQVLNRRKQLTGNPVAQIKVIEPGLVVEREEKVKILGY